MKKAIAALLSTCIIFLVCVEGARAYEFRWERRFVPSGISHISAFFAVYRTAECDICHGKTDKTLENLISVLPVLDMFSSKLYNLCNDAYGDFRMLCTSTAYVSGRMRLRKFLNGGQNMKKYLAMLLALVMVLALCACGNTSAPAADPTQAPAENTGDANAEQPAEEDLVSLAQAEGELVVYGSCEEEYLAAACQNFEKLYGIKTTYQRLSTGEVQAKIEEENGNPSADVWFGGTTDPYNVVAAEGLLEAYEAENASHLISDVYRNADGYWYGIYKGILGFMVNTDELTRLNLEAPQDWQDLLKPEY